MFLSTFARLHGYSYLRSLVKPLLSAMDALLLGTSYKADPAKATGQDIAQNLKKQTSTSSPRTAKGPKAKKL